MKRKQLVAGLFVAFTFLLVPNCVSAVEPDEELIKMLAEVCEKHDVPSLTIAAVRSDEIITMQCSGVRKRGEDDAVALSDRHPIGSCTKSMVATLAAVLVEAGAIKWDTTISEVWPKADKKLHLSLRDVTLDQLLSHQSGLLSDLGGKKWESFFDEKSDPQIERLRMLKLVLKNKPKHAQKEHHYSNIGYVVAAAMLEEKGDDTFENLMHAHVFGPLGMKSADFRTAKSAKKLKKPLLWGHVADGTAIDPRGLGAENPSVYASCGTVNLSIEDYAKYAQWHLKGEPAPVLKTKEAMMHLHAGQVDSPATGGKYGAGWIVVDMPGLGKGLNHGGSNTNSFALIWIFPEKNFAAVALTNTGEKGAFPACDEAMRELILQNVK